MEEAKAPQEISKENPPEKLFKKDFILIIIGQIISLFGNNILRFALPLYLLRQTGSAKLFWLVSALSLIPFIIISPLGGIIADRINKRNIMVVLDFLTAILISGYLFTYQNLYFVPILIITMMLLYGIQAAYAPAVQASIPFLFSDKKIVQANSVVNIINSLAMLSGPAIGGVIFGLYGMTPLLIVSIGCFLVSAIMEIFIHIPFTKSTMDEGLIKAFLHDFKHSIQYIFKEKRQLIKITLLICLLNLFLTSALSIGFPVLIIKVLKMSDQLLGYFQGGIVIGSIIGGIFAGIFGSKIPIKKLYLFLFSFSIIMLPIPLLLVYMHNTLFLYHSLFGIALVLLAFATIFNIRTLSYVQMTTDKKLIGKVVSYIITLSMCAIPIGSFIYGVLFDILIDKTWIIFLVTSLITLGIALYSKQVFAHLPEKE